MHCVAIPADVNPALRPALGALAEALTNLHYSAHAASAIVAYVAAEGTPAGAPCLEAEDEPFAELVFVESMPAVPFTSPEWDGPDDDGPHEPPDDWQGSSHAGWASLAPIAGGAPDDEPFAPSADDWRDYTEWSRGLDARREAEERAAAVRAWYERHPIAEFNAIRAD